MIQFIKRYKVLLLSIVSIFAIVYFVYRIGSIPIRGTINIDSSQSDRFKEIMDENGTFLWTGISMTGVMSVHFRNPITLCVIDDQILDDARTHKYWCEIRYECLFSIFNYKRTVSRKTFSLR